MKYVKILLGASALLMAGCASEFAIVSDDVPAAVVTSFNAKYPAAQNVAWEAEKMDGHLAFEAEFTMDGKKKEAYFKPDGTFISEE
jgi:hypothetical protein